MADLWDPAAQLASMKDALGLKPGGVEGTGISVATPANLHVVLKLIREITWGLLDEVNAGDPVYPELQRWNDRLDFYDAKIIEAQAVDPLDAQSILWTVTAPLFFGFYCGPSGDTVIIPATNFTSAVCTDTPSARDYQTPFVISNALALHDQLHADALVALENDLKQNAFDMASGVAEAVADVYKSAEKLLSALSEGAAATARQLPWIVWGVIGLGALFLLTRGKR